MDCKRFLKRAEKFLDELRISSGRKNITLGVSGGADSAVVLKLLSLFLKKGNIYPVILPYKTSTPQNIKDAENLCSVLNLDYEKINITPVVSAFQKKLQAEDKVRFGNICARVRMIILYDTAMKNQALVAGTGNKTELSLGYFTRWGDGACDFNLIGNLYKTEIWELARYLKLPGHIINKEPSADLWEGQTDEKEIGASYSDMDKILKSYFKGERRRPEGINVKTYNKIIQRLKRNKFKLKPAPAV